MKACLSVNPTGRGRVGGIFDGISWERNPLLDLRECVSVIP